MKRTLIIGAVCLTAGLLWGQVEPEHNLNSSVDGGFAQPESTLAEMIEQTIPHTVEATGMTEAAARSLTEQTLPQLKRWQA